MRAGEIHWSKTQERSQVLSQGEAMKISEFQRKVAELEGGVTEITIAQIAEVLKIANELTDGVLYAIIKRKEYQA